MPIAVVTGANSGIGHAFARFLMDEGYEVHACDREVGPQLQSLSPAQLHQLDVTSPASISAFAKELEGKHIDVLLNIAGVMSPPEKDGMETTDLEVLKRTFEVNTFGPLLLTQALLPNLVRNDGSVARVGIVSSRVGSIGDNSTGGSYAYRASKAAVNSIGKSLAMDLKNKNVVVILLHPGITKTNMVAGLGELPPDAVEPEEAAGKLWKVFVGKGMDETGTFWHREGFELPW
ncbi:hypothetical protein LTR78_006724 [Recurvomyces mirabilis]|uniref:NAD(P)-binding protein n=1 Tax=Recurvomyces mirabilis TaxID=574656 RepID=A0AAE1BZN0_9PEZI|nr:hypothetical protein LTR78_006724 [Recurvomyces mirabilis]KAK5151386.1 hypothetical protein LTS14_009229 [Recurvomyces mirabilis]